MITNDTLSIAFFGEMELKKGDFRLPDFPTRKSKELFARLVLEAPRAIPRDSLANLLWQDLETDKARKCLRTELWRIKKVLQSRSLDASCCLLICQHSVSFNHNMDHEFDVKQFESGLKVVLTREIEQLTQADFDLLKRCIAIYRGDLLESFDNAWFMLRREEFRSQYLIALELLVLYCMCQRDWNNAIVYANQLLSHDPLLEHIHRYLMQSYGGKGDRTSAINQYQSCRKLLIDELGVSPSSETEILYRDIIKRQTENTSKIPVSTPESLLNTVNQALLNIRQSERLLTRAADQLLK